MEEDLHTQNTGIKTSDRAMQRLESAVASAQEKIDHETAHNPQILLALSIVENFLKKKGRVCQGGTAINSILPDSMKFQSSEKDLPDYDFFTPNANEDVADLLDDFKKAGFKDVQSRVGIHAGTKKILVNFVPVADISEIDEELYSIQYRRSVLRNGVHQTDPDILRMLMFLELSRPKGQVERWTKVFERLTLLNKAFPMKGCRGSKARKTQKRRRGMSQEVLHRIEEFLIEKERIFLSGNVEDIQSKGIRSGHASWSLKGIHDPLLFMSAEPESDLKELASLFPDMKTSIFLHKAKGEAIPDRQSLKVGGSVVACAVREVACHSQYPIPLKGGRVVHLGSLETILTVNLGIQIFTTQAKELFSEPLDCLNARLIRLLEKNQVAPHSAFPAFSTLCKGHQVGFPTLMKEKVERIKQEKGALSSLSRSVTRRKQKK